RAWALARYTLHPIGAIDAPMDPTTFWDQKWSAAVIRCLRAANPPESHQRRTAERLNAPYDELDTGHYPMLSEPEKLTPLLTASRRGREGCVPATRVEAFRRTSRRWTGARRIASMRTIEVLSPAAAKRETAVPLAPRVPALAGRVVGLLDNSKSG